MSDEITLLTVRLSAEEKVAIDDYRRRQDDLPSRPQAVRTLAMQSLQQQKECEARGVA
jgi:hypothetical protein